VIEHSQLVEELQPRPCCSPAGEVKPSDLIGRENVMLVAVEGDLTIPLGEVFCELRDVTPADPAWTLALGLLFTISC
jgi:hypothetical protein